MARHVVAEPASNWVRLSLPVVALAAIAPTLFVTTFVALCAVFGLVRQVANQVGRYASVRYVQRLDVDPTAAERIVVRCLLFCTVISVAVSAVTIADHGRLLGLWLRKGDPGTESVIAMSFAFGATDCGYQVIAGVLIRAGDVPAVAKRFVVLGG